MSSSANSPLRLMRGSWNCYATQTVYIQFIVIHGSLAIDATMDKPNEMWPAEIASHIEPV